jgi:hypothetical protein
VFLICGVFRPRGKVWIVEIAVPNSGRSGVILDFQRHPPAAARTVLLGVDFVQSPEVTTAFQSAAFPGDRTFPAFESNTRKRASFEVPMNTRPKCQGGRYPVFVIS